MTARIYGTITDSATGQVIPTSTASCPGYSVVNRGGGYWFLTVGAATCDVTAQAPNYVPQTKQITVGDGTINQLNFILVHV